MRTWRQKGPLSYCDHSDRAAHPPLHGSAQNSAVTKALSLQEALATLRLFSHVVDR